MIARRPESLEDLDCAVAHATRLSFRVDDWMADGLGLHRKEDWLAWAHGQNATAVPAEPEKTLPPLLRRRVSPIGQQAFRAAAALHKRPDGRFVFCSRHGEFQRTLGLLRTIAENEPTSPADFSLSVHNALAGLLSIGWKNQRGHTAVAAGADSFGYGLLEAVTCLFAEPSRSVGLVYFDEPLPGIYGELAEDDDAPLALALLLTAAAGGDGDITLATEPADSSEAPRSASGQALDFLRFFLSGRPDATSPGAGVRWRWHRVG